MTVEELQIALEKLPRDAKVLVARSDEGDTFDPLTGIGRLLIQQGTKGSGGKVIAGILYFRCDHR